MTLPLVLSLLVRTVLRSLVMDTFGVILVLVGLFGGGVQEPERRELPIGRCSFLLELRSCFHVFGTTGTGVWEVLKNIMVGTRGDEFDVIDIGSGKAIDVHNK